MFARFRHATRFSGPRFCGWGRYRGPMRHGFTLLELILTVVLVGLLIGIAMPPARRMLDRVTVDGAAREIATAHAYARITAVVRSRAMVLTIAPDTIVLRPRGDTTTLWGRP